MISASAATCRLMASPIAWATPASPTGRPRGNESCAADLSEAPADRVAIALVELWRVGFFRRLAHAHVEFVCVVADQDTPMLRLDAIENDLCGPRRRRRRLVAERACAVER